MYLRSLVLIAAGSVLIACSASTDPNKLQATAAAPNTQPHLGMWFWIASSSNAKRTAVADPSRFSLEFFADGTVKIVADCNRGQSSYQISAGKLSISAPGLTKIGCGSKSRDREFIAAITQAQAIVTVGAQLQIEFAADQKMLFARAAGAKLP